MIQSGQLDDGCCLFFDLWELTLICQVQSGGVLPSLVLQHNLIHACILFGNLMESQERESDSDRDTESAEVSNCLGKASFIFWYSRDAADTKTHVGHKGKKAVGQKQTDELNTGGILRQDGMTTTTATTTTVPNFKRSPDQHFCRVFCVGWEVALKWDHTECYQRLWPDAARESRDMEWSGQEEGLWDSEW